MANNIHVLTKNDGSVELLFREPKDMANLFGVGVEHARVSVTDGKVDIYKLGSDEWERLWETTPLKTLGLADLLVTSIAPGITGFTMPKVNVGDDLVVDIHQKNDKYHPGWTIYVITRLRLKNGGELGASTLEVEVQVKFSVGKPRPYGPFHSGLYVKYGPAEPDAGFLLLNEKTTACFSYVYRRASGTEEEIKQVAVQHMRRHHPNRIEYVMEHQKSVEELLDKTKEYAINLPPKGRLDTLFNQTIKLVAHGEFTTPSQSGVRKHEIAAGRVLTRVVKGKKFLGLVNMKKTVTEEQCIKEVFWVQHNVHWWLLRGQVVVL